MQVINDLAKLLTCVDSPRGCSPWLGTYCFGDLAIDPSQWLVATRQGLVLHDLKIMDRWSCHRSKSLTCRKSPRGCSPWIMANRWCRYRYKSVTRLNSPRGGSYWLLDLWISQVIYIWFCGPFVSQLKWKWRCMSRWSWYDLWVPLCNPWPMTMGFAYSMNT